MAKRIMILGYYGYGNFGDELILANMISGLRKTDPSVQITVLSGDPEQTQALHRVNAMYIGRRYAGIPAIWGAMQKTDLLILGGGGLLQDRELRNVPYWLFRVKMALFAGCKVMYYAQGIGPLRTQFASWMVKVVSNQVHAITLRDRDSWVELKRLGVKRPPMSVTADPAFAMTAVRTKDREDGIIRIGISVRHWPGIEDVLPVMVEAIRLFMQNEPGQIIWLPMETTDVPLATAYSLDWANAETRQPVLHSDGTVSGLEGIDLMISMRLHGLILAAAHRIPFIGVAYDPKVRQVAAEMGLDQWVVDLHGMTSDHLAAHMQALWEHRLDVRSHLDLIIPDLAAKALSNAEVALKLLEH